MITNQPVFALTPYYCVLSGEATNTNFIVFGFTRPGLEHTIYNTRGVHTTVPCIGSVGRLFDVCNPDKQPISNTPVIHLLIKAVAGLISVFKQYVVGIVMRERAKICILADKYYNQVLLHFDRIFVTLQTNQTQMFIFSFFLGDTMLVYHLKTQKYN